MSLLLVLPEAASVHTDWTDATGRVVMEVGARSFPSGTHEWTIDGRNLAQGIYSCRVHIDFEGYSVQRVLRVVKSR
jgi:flagellar hook assembly protein FlgD